MRTIHKFVVPIDDVVRAHKIPTGAVVRHVEMQGMAACVWMEVQTDAPKVTRKLTVFGTGHPIPDGFGYVGTALDDPFVWHVFELMNAVSEGVSNG